jgi:cellulose biosynthesis protein BcsQ
MANKVICFASAKGGSGKTTIAATIGAFLSAINKKVLLIDTDSATNGLTLLYLKEVLQHYEILLGKGINCKGIYEGINSATKIEPVILSTGAHLIPATFEFKNTDEIDISVVQESLTCAVKASLELYDYILIDAQAGSDNFARIAMNKKVSDEVVIVSEYDPMSAAGIERLKSIMREDLVYLRTWVLLNKMLPDFIKSFSDFLQVAKYLPPIPWDADVVKAYARRKLAIDLETGNEYTLAIMQTIRALLGEDIDKPLEEWSREKSSVIREPISEQYSAIENELKAIIAFKYKIEKKKERRRYLYALGGVMAITTLAMSLIFFLPDIFGTSKIFTIYSILALLGVVFVFISNPIFSKNDKKPESTIENARLESQQAVLEDKLKKLEILKQADFQTLVRKAKEL